jgi:hypothetical protein
MRLLPIDYKTLFTKIEDEEALKVVKVMPHLSPAIKNGKAVRSNIVVPIRMIGT